MSAYGAHAEPNKILAAPAKEPSAIKQRTDHDILLRNAALPWTRNYKLYQQALQSRDPQRWTQTRWTEKKSFRALVLLCFQFKHCTRVPSRKPDMALCCDEHQFVTLLKRHSCHRKFCKQKPSDRIY